LTVTNVKRAFEAVAAGIETGMEQREEQNDCQEAGYVRDLAAQTTETNPPHRHCLLQGPKPPAYYTMSDTKFSY